MEEQDTRKQQMGVRIAGDLLIEAKVLAARQKRRLNDVVEEALRDLLKKHARTKKT
jgi:predicted HicB family RNase H-like nuclease